MTLIAKRTPGSAPGFQWDEPDQVHDVPRELAGELLHIKDADFYEVNDHVEHGGPEVESLPRKKGELQDLARSLGLDDGGTVAELTDRITEHREAADGDGESDGSEDDGDEQGAGDDVEKTPVTEPDPDAHSA
jgi:hypothetical protein